MNSEDTSTMLTAALVYAAHDVPVFPVWGVTDDGRCTCGAPACKNIGKHPLGRLAPKGFKNATTDETQIRGWWEDEPDANIGTPTATRLVLDVDSRHGGDETLAELERRHGVLPLTPLVLTGGGRHYRFAMPTPALGNSAGKLGPGLDTRGVGGYALLPPSRHASGQRYRDDTDRALFELPLAPVPAWMLRMLVQPSPNGSPTEATNWAALLAGTPEGERHAVATRIAGHYLGKGLPPAEVEQILRGYSMRCEPAFPAAEARRIVHDLAEKDRREADRSNTEPRLCLIPWSEMAFGPVEPVTYDWPGWVAQGTVALVAGAGESLKSWLTLYLAVMRAAGRSLFDRQDDAAPAGPVLYFTAENALAEEKRRCGLLKAGLGLPDELPLTFVPAESLCLGDDMDYSEALALVASIRPVAIVIDSAIALSGITQENDNSEVRRFMRERILPLSRKYGATVYLIGHSPKPPLQAGARFTDEHVARGASDWRNAADTVLYLRRDTALGELAVVIRHSKTRVGPKHTPIWFTLEDVIPGKAAAIVYGGTYDAESGQGQAAGLLRAVMAAIDVLKASPGGLYRQGLLDQLTASGVSKATARRALDIVRGKKPWPGGSLRGRMHAVTAEDHRGRCLFLTFIAAQLPTEGDPDDE